MLKVLMVKIIKRIIDIVFILIIAILSLYFVLRLTNRVVIYKVQTGSMERGIHVNDYIFVLKQNSYKKNDVITFKYEDTFITHRIVKIDGNKIITKGDANNVEDDEISVDKVVGKVIYNGGILNIIIDYKYVVIASMLVVYIATILLDKASKMEENDGKDNKVNKK
jgi:signal peptidase I